MNTIIINAILRTIQYPSGATGGTVVPHTVLCKEDTMFGLGFPELIIIMMIVLIIFGAGKLPEIGGAIGKGIKSFKKSVREPDEIDVTPKNDQEKPKTP